MENQDLYSAEYFTENFRELLVVLNTTPEEAAQKIGVDTQLVDMWLNGWGIPDMCYMCLICNTLDISPEWMLTKHIPLKYKPRRI